MFNVYHLYELFWIGRCVAFLGRKKHEDFHGTLHLQRSKQLTKLLSDGVHGVFFFASDTLGLMIVSFVHWIHMFQQVFETWTTKTDVRWCKAAMKTCIIFWGVDVRIVVDEFSLKTILQLLIFEKIIGILGYDLQLHALLCFINRWNLHKLAMRGEDSADTSWWPKIKALRKLWEGKPAVKTQNLSGQNHQNLNTITGRWPYRIFLKSKRPLPVCFMTRKTTNPFLTLVIPKTATFCGFSV